MLRMTGQAPRETAECLQQKGEAKVMVEGKPFVVKGTTFDDGRYSISGRFVDAEYASHMPMANADMKLLIERIQWEQPIDIESGWPTPE